MSTNTKLYALTVFLGSGKIILLLKMLDELKNHRIGIIQNKFGKLGVITSPSLMANAKVIISGRVAKAVELVKALQKM